ncbi:hypothetical protein ABZS66_60265 [Dactylosporangium sp. NPDC005572]|uniref:DUF7158 domain-containing protein n=1 Tax=Dactylosporangium sp. NPDC005572 TaxID=3156889 RepID=UPI0033B483EA
MNGVAAWVGERAIAVVAVEERLAAMRRGPYAARLPHPDTAEGRNLRRWLVQVLVAEAVVEHEAAALGVVADDEEPRPLTLAEALRTGGVTAAVVAAHPLARALRLRVAPPLPASDEVTADYHRRNRDRHPEPLDDVRAGLAARLGAEDAERRFAAWLDGRYAALVRLAPGYEHPADPRHPDATHRH